MIIKKPASIAQHLVGKMQQLPDMSDPKYIIQLNEMLWWCLENLVPGSYVFCANGNHIQSHPYPVINGPEYIGFFAFRDEDAAMACKLRWC